MGTAPSPNAHHPEDTRTQYHARLQCLTTPTLETTRTRSYQPRRTRLPGYDSGSRREDQQERVVPAGTEAPQPLPDPREQRAIRDHSTSKRRSRRSTTATLESRIE